MDEILQYSFSAARTGRHHKWRGVRHSRNLYGTASTAALITRAGLRSYAVCGDHDYAHLFTESVHSRPAVIFTAVVASKIGAPPDGETVSFMKGKTVLGTGSLSGGSASFTTAKLPWAPTRSRQSTAATPTSTLARRMWWRRWWKSWT